MNAQAAMEPEFSDTGLPVLLRQLQDAAASAISRRNKQQVVIAPDGRADVQSPISRMWMAPEQLAVIRVNAGDHLPHKSDELVLPVNVDDDRRRRSHIQSPILPGD